jgi:hypothetical protein
LFFVQVEIHGVAPPVGVFDDLAFSPRRKKGREDFQIMRREILKFFHASLRHLNKRFAFSLAPPARAGVAAFAVRKAFCGRVIREIRGGKFFSI